MIVDVLFPSLGDVIPIDHAYLLYGALTQAAPAFHEPAGGLRFAPITGESIGAGHLRLTERSRLRVRLQADAIRTVLPLAGKRLAVASDVRRPRPETPVPVRGHGDVRSEEPSGAAE